MFSKDIHNNDYYIQHICQYINLVVKSIDNSITPYIFVGDVHSSILQMFVPLKEAGILKSINFNYKKKRFEYELDLDNLESKPCVVYTGDIVGRPSHSYPIELYFAFMNIIININEKLLGLPITTYKELHKLNLRQILSIKNSKIVWVFGNHDTNFIVRFIHINIENIPGRCLSTPFLNQTSIHIDKNELNLYTKSKYFNRFIFLLLEFALYNPYPYIFTIDINKIQLHNKNINKDSLIIENPRRTPSRNAIELTEKLILDSYTPGITIKDPNKKIESKSTDNISCEIIPSPELTTSKKHMSLSKIENYTTPEILKIFNEHLKDEVDDIQHNKIDPIYLQVSHTIVNKYRIETTFELINENKGLNCEKSKFKPTNINHKTDEILTDLINEFEVSSLDLDLDNSLNLENKNNTLKNEKDKKKEDENKNNDDDVIKKYREKYTIVDNLLFFKCINDDEIQTIKNRCLDYYKDLNIKTFNWKKNKNAKIDYMNPKYDSLRNIDKDIWFNNDIKSLKNIKSKQMYIDNIDEICKEMSKFNNVGYNINELINRLDDFEDKLGLKLNIDKLNDYVRYLCLFNPFIFGRKIEYEIFTQRYTYLSTPLIYKSKGTTNTTIANKKSIKRIYIKDKLRYSSILDLNSDFDIKNYKKLDNKHYVVKNMDLISITHKCYTKPMNTIQVYGHDGNYNGYCINSLPILRHVDTIINKLGPREVINRIYENQEFNGYIINNVARNYLCELIEKYKDKYDEIKQDIIDAIKMEIITTIGKQYLLEYYPLNKEKHMYIDKSTMMHFIDINSSSGMLNLIFDKDRYTIIGHNSCMFAYLTIQKDNENVKVKMKYSKLYNI